MRRFSQQFFVVLFLSLAVSACGVDSDHREATSAPQEGTNTGGSSGKSDNADAESNPEGVPDVIHTSGAHFEGVVAANASLSLRLIADEGDTVVMWFRPRGDEAWSPRLTMYRPGKTRALVYSSPGSGEDAHIPYQKDRLESGWEFYDGGEYRLELANQSDVEAAFEFVLECLAGPCKGVDPGESDAGGDSSPDSGEAVATESPYDDLSEDDLRRALKATHHSHRSLNYDGARDFIFEYDMAHVGADDEIECAYTGRRAFVSGRRDAQSRHDYNTEHTWPQSRGASGVAKSDIHHLFVVDAMSNSKRSSYYFDDVVDVDWSEGGSKLGANAAGEIRFEPRDEHKGNVARAMLYFSVVYDYSMRADEEAAMRAWHVLDPVDDAERARNDAVEEAQKNRNFFIDWPHLVEKISDY
ncbi:endonuclease I family protein [Bradymonas sediminis]|uniref:Uncharacterized protein n=1 Tax=Bradymonas sediminis TaxID=1548548 RepID=A0A2Z4FP13_9DELT|nr:endonuclease [Bradymonas sediminis]AWV90622.1 hypothetical protein DN745_15340 [Bradymonas sediminis]TDP62378.1 endonuclease I [Bradymonas sediminis]